MTETTTPEGTPSEQSFDVVFRAADALTPRGRESVEVGVKDGRIVAVEPLGAGLQADSVVEVPAGQVLIPGLVDTHVHVNEPGRTEWEGFETATRAAAAGGVTTIVDMPLNSIPPTVNTEALAAKQESATGELFVDTGFWGGAIPGNTDDLRPLHDQGVFGFKCFLEHSGVDEVPRLEVEEMQQDMAVLAGFDGLMIVHAEDADTLEELRLQTEVITGARYADFLASRPRDAEEVAIRAVIDAVRTTGARAHILHLSDADALDEIAAAKAEGLPLTVETCPHYLTLLSEEIGDGLTAFKCCPPIREDENRARLWQGLEDGTIDIIVSDHSPSTLDLKDLENGDFAAAWGGISSLQLGLSVIWTEAQKRGIELDRVIAWMSSRPAEIARVPRKGRLEVGYDADLAVFDPSVTWTVDAEQLHHRNPITAYQDKELTGKVLSTWLRGEQVDFQTPRGQFLRRES